MASVDEIKGALAGWTKNEHNINAPLLHDDWNILQFACSIDDSDTLKYCLEHRADVNYQSLSRVAPRVTPLHILAHYDLLSLIQDLPSRTNFNKQDQWGFTPLHYAVSKGNVRTVQMLIERGANVLVKSKNGSTPLDIAKSLEFGEIISILDLKSRVEGDPTYVQFKDWLNYLGAAEYLNAFVLAGYDISFIKRHGLNDADLECVGIPPSKLGLRKKLVALHDLDRFFSDGEADGDAEDGEEEEEQEEEEEEEEG